MEASGTFVKNGVTKGVANGATDKVRPFLINNEWVEGSGEPFVSTNPADGSEIARISAASPADIDSAVAAARAALSNPAWRDLKPHERARLLYRVGELIDADLERLARVQMQDNGKTLKECRQQVASAAGTFRYYAGACETFESEVTPPRGNYWTMTVREPVGVVGGYHRMELACHARRAQTGADPGGGERCHPEGLRGDAAHQPGVCGDRAESGIPAGRGERDCRRRGAGPLARRTSGRGYDFVHRRNKNRKRDCCYHWAVAETGRAGTRREVAEHRVRGCGFEEGDSRHGRWNFLGRRAVLHCGLAHLRSEDDL